MNEIQTEARTWPWPASNPRVAIDAFRLTIVALCVLLAGCGTDVRSLLSEESRTYWQDQETVAAAEELDLGLENPVFDAESAKYQNCESVYNATKDRIYAGELSSWEQFWSKFTEILVRIIPIESVERCAAAHERYDKEVVALRERLGKMGIRLPLGDQEGLGR